MLIVVHGSFELVEALSLDWIGVHQLISDLSCLMVDNVKQGIENSVCHAMTVSSCICCRILLE